MKDHISYSQVSTFLRCPEQWRQRYIEGRVIPPAIAMLKGSAVHKTAEVNNRQKIKSFKDLPKKDIVEIAVNNFEENSKGEIFMSETETSIGKDNVVSKTVDSIISVSEVYADEMAPSIQPIECELFVEQEIEGAKFVAYIDVIDNKNNIRDMKVTGKSKTQGDIDSSIQLTAYSMFYPTAGLVIDNLVDKKKPEYKTFVTKRDDLHYSRFLRTVEMMLKSIKSGVFMPPAEGSWVCSERFCGYYGKCEYTRRAF